MIGDELDSPEQVVRRGETLDVCLWYPRQDGQVKAIYVDLVDVRAADGIRLSYDFDRDGWRIEQASVFEWHIDDAECDPGWKEVAFVKASPSQRKQTENTREAHGDEKP